MTSSYEVREVSSVGVTDDGSVSITTTSGSILTVFPSTGQGYLVASNGNAGVDLSGGQLIQIGDTTSGGTSVGVLDVAGGVPLPRLEIDRMGNTTIYSQDGYTVLASLPAGDANLRFSPRKSMTYGIAHCTACTNRV